MYIFLNVNNPDLRHNLLGAIGDKVFVCLQNNIMANKRDSFMIYSL